MKLPRWLLSLDHKVYLRSATWRRVRQVAVERAAGCCEKCRKRRRLQVHHLTYARVGGDELPTDLMALCRACHMKAHGLAKPARAKRPKAPRPRKSTPRTPTLPVSTWTLTDAQIRRKLKREVDRIGGLRAWGRMHSLNPSLLHRAISGKTPLPPVIVAALGYERVVTYRKVGP